MVDLELAKYNYIRNPKHKREEAKDVRTKTSVNEKKDEQVRAKGKDEQSNGS